MKKSPFKHEIASSGIILARFRKTFILLIDSNDFMQLRVNLGPVGGHVGVQSCRKFDSTSNALAGVEFCKFDKKSKFAVWTFKNESGAFDLPPEG